MVSVLRKPGIFSSAWNEEGCYPLAGCSGVAGRVEVVYAGSDCRCKPCKL